MVVGQAKISERVYHAAGEVGDEGAEYAVSLEQQNKELDLSYPEETRLREHCPQGLCWKMSDWVETIAEP